MSNNFDRMDDSCICWSLLKMWSDVNRVHVNIFPELWIFREHFNLNIDNWLPSFHFLQVEDNEFIVSIFSTFENIL